MCTVCDANGAAPGRDQLVPNDPSVCECGNTIGLANIRCKGHALPSELSRVSPHMDYLAWTGFLNSRKQFPLDSAVMDMLIFGNMRNDHADLQFGKIVLKFEAAINGS